MNCFIKKLLFCTILVHTAVECALREQAEPAATRLTYLKKQHKRSVKSIPGLYKQLCVKISPTEYIVGDYPVIADYLQHNPDAMTFIGIKNPWICPFCFDNICQSGSLLKHIRAIHLYAEEKYPCTECNVTFSSPIGLSNHKFEYHQDARKRHCIQAFQAPQIPQEQPMPMVQNIEHEPDTAIVSRAKRAETAPDATADLLACLTEGSNEYEWLYRESPTPSANIAACSYSDSK